MPTVWLMLLQHLEANDAKLPHLKKVAIGGPPGPRASQDVQEIMASRPARLGMTVMSPLGLLGLPPEYARLSGRNG